MNEKGAPTPVALTRLRAPESLMGPSAEALVRSTVAGSALLGKYGTAVDNASAYEKLTGKAAAPTVPAAAEPAPAGAPATPAPATPAAYDVDAEARRIEEEILGRPSSRPAQAPVPAPQDPEPQYGGPQYGERREPEPGAKASRAPRAPRSREPQSREPEAQPGGMMGDLGGVIGGALGGGLKSMARSMGTQLGRELLRGVFGTSSRRRRR
jgi:uncharacterized protein